MTDQYARATNCDSSLDIANFDCEPLLTDRRRFPRPQPMRTRDLITQKLTKAFAPAALEVLDESHLHEGHAGHRPGGESHFRLYIVADAFKGKSRVERHRMVNETLMSELKGSIHALAIRTFAPGEEGS
jgi:BolA family transcriptional regulator, general stress-responsive regulator